MFPIHITKRVVFDNYSYSMSDLIVRMAKKTKHLKMWHDDDSDPKECQVSQLGWARQTSTEQSVQQMTNNWRNTTWTLVVTITSISEANARRSVHRPWDHFIITLIVSDRCDWRDTRGKWPFAKNPNRCWWYRHISLQFFGQSPWLHGQQVV